MAQGLVEVVSNFAPLLDAADGMKADMERRGWSPTMAEQIAGQWLAHMLAVAFNPPQGV